MKANNILEAIFLTKHHWLMSCPFYKNCHLLISSVLDAWLLSSALTEQTGAAVDHFGCAKLPLCGKLVLSTITVRVAHGVLFHFKSRLDFSKWF